MTQVVLCVSIGVMNLPSESGRDGPAVGYDADIAPSRDMSLRQLSDWAGGQALRLAANFGLDPARDSAYFALAQTVKLGEEVGELHAEVLGALKYHRADKAGQYGAGTLGGELADVMVCLALAQILDVDLAEAVSAKVSHLEARNRPPGPGD
jgi:NTP pyrophosphatase (non-canonical NTP hydrolase)